MKVKNHEKLYNLSLRSATPDQYDDTNILRMKNLLQICEIRLKSWLSVSSDTVKWGVLDDF